MKLNFHSFILFAFLLLSQFCKAQEDLQPEWVIREASSLTFFNAEAWAIGTGNDGSLYWGVNKDEAGQEFMNAHIYNVSSEGSINWTEAGATGPFAQQTYNLKVTDDKLYSGGRTCSNANIDSCDLLFFASDLATGETDWLISWDGGFGYEEIDGISPQADGIILSGWTKGDGTELDILLMKIDYSGNIIWTTTWGGMMNRDDHQDGHIVVDDSIIYMTGLWGGSPLLGWEGQALLAKFDKNTGAFVDSVTFGRDDVWVNAENGLGLASDGEYLYATGYSTTSVNNWDIFLTKYDKNLNEVWYTNWGGDQGESARAITVAPDGSIFVGGNTESYGEGEMDIALLKFNPSGELLWSKIWGEEGDDQVLDIHLNGDKLYITGKTNSFHPNQKWEALLMSVSIDSSTSLDHVQASTSQNVSVYPNPMNQLTTFEVEGELPYHIKIYNSQGLLVRNINNVRSSKYIFNREELAAGAYYWKATSTDNIQLKTGKLILQ